MPIINFKFVKIMGNKEQQLGSMSTNVEEAITMKEISSANISLNQNQGALKFTVQFDAFYKQGNDVKAVLQIVSEVTYLDEKKKVDEILNRWSSKKPINPDLIAEVHNLALTKSLIHALVLADSLTLPSPVNLPKIKVNVEKQ